MSNIIVGFAYLILLWLQHEEVQLNLHEKKKTTIDSAHFETIIDGMHKVVEYGTARIARIKGIEV